MALEIEVRPIAARSYVGVRRQLKPLELGAACGEIYPRLHAWLKAKGLSPEGPPALVYHSMDEKTGTFDAQPAFFVAEALAGEGEIAAGETAGGEALVALHVGSYTTLGETWGAVFERAKQLGRPVTNSSWELYLNHPGEVSEADLRTEIFVPIAPV